MGNVSKAGNSEYLGNHLSPKNKDNLKFDFIGMILGWLAKYEIDYHVINMKQCIVGRESSGIPCCPDEVILKR